MAEFNDWWVVYKPTLTMKLQFYRCDPDSLKKFFEVAWENGHLAGRLEVQREQIEKTS
jgi:hypothetical protein